MSDATNHKALYDEIRALVYKGFEIREIPSEQAGRLVEQVVAMDCGDPVCEGLLWDSLELLARALPQDEHFSTRLTTLFNRAAPIGSSNVRDLMRDLFCLNPDVLAEPLVAFVRGDPMGERQTKLLTNIFNPATFRQQIVVLYPRESYDQNVQGLKRAAAGIDKLRTKQGVLAIVEGLITSFESERAAKINYKDLFLP